MSVKEAAGSTGLTSSQLEVEYIVAPLEALAKPSQCADGAFKE